jgi:hypothetical protein
MSNPSVQEIVEKWLKDNGYSGLFCDNCGCEIDDLMPCSGDISGLNTCEAGYKVHCDTNCPECERNDWCDMDPEFSDWYITGEK